VASQPYRGLDVGGTREAIGGGTISLRSQWRSGDRVTVPGHRGFEERTRGRSEVPRDALLGGAQGTQAVAGSTFSIGDGTPPPICPRWSIYHP